jgi:hypothetical protein
MLSAGVSLERGLGGFTTMFGADPVLPLRALGFFRDGVRTIPEVRLTPSFL